MSFSPRCAAFAKWLLLLIVLFLWPARTFAQTNIIFNYTNLLWKFRANSTNFTGNWTSLDFDDGSWSNGFGVFATQNEALPSHATSTGARVNTLLSTNNNGSYAISYYFRAKFDFPSNGLMQLTFPALFDDGAIIYVNGREVRRIRMPHGDVYATNYSLSSIEVSNTNDTFAIVEPMNVGLAIIAVQLHQAPPVGSFKNPDAVFGLALQVSVPADSPPQIVEQPGSIVAELGQPTQLRARVNGVPVPSFQWYWNGAPITGAEETTLAFPFIWAGAAGTYFLVASNALGVTTSSVATVHVNLPVYIRTNSV